MVKGRGRAEWAVAFYAALLTMSTTASGCELRNLRLQDIDLATKVMHVRVGKNRCRARTVPLNETATWALERLLSRARELGAKEPGDYLIPCRVSGKTYAPKHPPSPWAWRTEWRKLTEAAGISRLRLHDLRHHAVTRLAELNAASEETIMAISGHISREMLQHYSHIRLEARRKAVAALDDVTILTQLTSWKSPAARNGKWQLVGKKGEGMVGPGGRF